MTWPFFQGDVELDPEGGYVPLVVSCPEYNPETQKLVPAAPEEVDGVWRVLHTAEDLTSPDKNLQAALLEEKERLAKKLAEAEMLASPELAQDMENLNGSAPDVVG
jgi:hypothetical protein